MEKKLTVGPISADPPSGNGPCLELALGVAAKPVGDLAEKTEPRNINETNFSQRTLLKHFCLSHFCYFIYGVQSSPLLEFAAATQALGEALRTNSAA